MILEGAPVPSAVLERRTLVAKRSWIEESYIYLYEGEEELLNCSKNRKSVEHTRTHTRKHTHEDIYLSNTKVCAHNSAADSTSNCSRIRAALTMKAE